jgi:hypothetical protein
MAGNGPALTVPRSSDRMNVWSSYAAASWQIFVVYFFACFRLFLYHEALSVMLQHRLNDFSLTKFC